MTSRTMSVLELVTRRAHRVGEWIFDRGGPLQPALSRLAPMAHRAFPDALLADADRSIEVGGLRLHHRGRSTLHMQMLAMGTHDRDVANALERFTKAGATVVDVGAHLGYFSLLAARLAGPSGTVWAFEPSPELVAVLRENALPTAGRAPIQVVAQAVSDSNGQADLYGGGPDEMCNSLHASVASPVRYTTVERTSLDEWWAVAGRPPVDIVKIDVEGHEVAVLVGMRCLCGRSPGLVAIVELNPRALQAAEETLASFWDALARCGFNHIEIAGTPGPELRFPRDVAAINREIRRQGNDRVNLVCRRSGTRGSSNR